MKKSNLDLYTDYLLSTFGATTATGLSAMVEGDVSHDQITRFLSEQDYTSKDLWLQIKSTVRMVEHEDAVSIRKLLTILFKKRPGRMKVS